jgi:SOUL heme-binding protein
MKHLSGVFFMLLASSASAAEESGSYKGNELPSYTVVMKTEQGEIRQYDPQLVAEVAVEGARSEAINEGFRILAAYIFGENDSAGKVAMTAPVTQEPAGNTIAMTTPVTQEKAGKSWIVRFGMPRKYTQETLPKPRDSRIRLAVTPPAKRAVVKFSGLVGDEKITAQTKRLEEFIAQHKLTRTGEVMLAFYDAPFSLPWSRRHEVSAPVE